VGPSQNSQLAQVLCAEGFQLVSVTTDDFFARHALPDPDVDSVVTNPPYGRGGRLAQRFIEHALELPVSVVAMLLRVDFDSGISRPSPVRALPGIRAATDTSRRIVWFPNRIEQERPSDNHAWFLWDKRNHEKPIVTYAHPRDLAAEAAR
jgi:hypothetical protein